MSFRPESMKRISDWKLEQVTSASVKIVICIHIRRRLGGTWQFLSWLFRSSDGPGPYPRPGKTGEAEAPAPAVPAASQPHVDICPHRSPWLIPPTWVSWVGLRPPLLERSTRVPRLVDISTLHLISVLKFHPGRPFYCFKETERGTKRGRGGGAGAVTPVRLSYPRHNRE